MGDNRREDAYKYTTVLLSLIKIEYALCLIHRVNLIELPAAPRDSVQGRVTT